MTASLRLLALLALPALGAFGCNEPQPQSLVADLPPSAGLTPGNDWQSVDMDGTDAWTRYDGKTTLTFEHTLGYAPSSVLIYVSFNAEGSGAALAAGDMARIVAVDDHAVTIENHTEANFFVRVVLR